MLGSTASTRCASATTASVTTCFPVPDITPGGVRFIGVPERPGVIGLPRIQIGGSPTWARRRFLPNYRSSRSCRRGYVLVPARAPTRSRRGELSFIRSFFDICEPGARFLQFHRRSRRIRRRARTAARDSPIPPRHSNVTQLSTSLLGDIRYHYTPRLPAGRLAVNCAADPDLGVRYEVFTTPL